MEGAEKFVQGEINAAIIAFKIPMMKLMMKMSQHQSFPVLNNKHMKTGMPKDR